MYFITNGYKRFSKTTCNSTDPRQRVPLRDDLTQTQLIVCQQKLVFIFILYPVTVRHCICNIFLQEHIVISHRNKEMVHFRLHVVYSQCKPVQRHKL